MGMKEMMMERMIDNMSPEEKRKMMNPIRNFFIRKFHIGMVIYGIFIGM